MKTITVEIKNAVEKTAKELASQFSQSFDKCVKFETWIAEAIELANTSYLTNKKRCAYWHTQDIDELCPVCGELCNPNF